MCNLPTTGVIGVWDIIEDCIRLRKKLRQSYVIKRSRAYGKDAMAIPTKGTERVKGGGRKLISEGEEDDTQSFATRKSNEVASLSFLGVSKETAHLD